MRQPRLMSLMPRAAAALALAAACVTSSTCGSSSPASPSATPTPSSPSLPTALPGVWRGNLRVVNCYSTFSICDAEQTMPFVLRVTAGGPGFIGAFELEAPLYNAIIEVTGQSQADGAVLLTGSRGRTPSNSATFDLRRLLVRVDGAAGLTGDIDLRTFVTGSERSLIGQVTSASYQPIAPSGENVSGNWSGLAVIRSCSGYCPGHQTVGSPIRVSMVLGQSGSTVDGQLQLSNFSCSSCWLPLNGRLADSRLTLSSPTVSRTATSGDRSLHLESFEASLDPLYRLAGVFVYASDSRIAISPFDVSYRFECEILWLKRD
jgi:hypothetical protein